MKIQILPEDAHQGVPGCCYMCMLVKTFKRVLNLDTDVHYEGGPFGRVFVEFYDAGKVITAETEDEKLLGLLQLFDAGEIDQVLARLPFEFEIDLSKLGGSYG